MAKLVNVQWIGFVVFFTVCLLSVVPTLESADADDESQIETEQDNDKIAESDEKADTAAASVDTKSHSKDDGGDRKGGYQDEDSAEDGGGGYGYGRSSTASINFRPGQPKGEVEKVKKLLEAYRAKEQQRFAKSREEPTNASVEVKRPDITKDSGYVEAPDIVKQNEELKDFLYNGDCALSLEQATKLLGDKEQKSERCKRGALNLEYCGMDYKWPHNIIPYNFHKSIVSETRTKILKAMDIWSNKTCLSFQKKTIGKEGAAGLVFSDRGKGCWSYIGKVSESGQYVNIHQPYCAEVGIILHEIGHALGLYHHHQRYDRDDNIEILYNNVKENLDQFDKATNDTMNTYGFPYDYGSIMHYDGTAFSIDNATNTMLATEGPPWQNSMGQGRGLAWVDHETINAHYGCRNVCANCLTKREPKKKTKCANGGLTNPRDWTRCICPAGFGGKRCTKLQVPANSPSGCRGKMLHATSKWKKLVGKISATDATFDTVSASCHWHILAPNSKHKIRVEVEKLTGACSKGCFYGSVEIKHTKNFTHSGISLCCESSLGTEQKLQLNSEGRRVLINLYASLGREGTGTQGFRLRYKALKDKKHGYGY